jgi:hypothetical protein
MTDEWLENCPIFKKERRIPQCSCECAILHGCTVEKEVPRSSKEI